MTVGRTALLLVALGAAGGACFTQPAFATDLCVDVEIAGDRAPSLDCINQQLKQQVETSQPFKNHAPVDARSPTVQFGGFNAQALRQQYGPNLGQSAVPFRPAQTFGSPLRSSP